MSPKNTPDSRKSVKNDLRQFDPFISKLFGKHDQHIGIHYRATNMNYILLNH